LILEIGIIRKCTLALHISKGIQSIHQIKAAHRDIKSKNVFFVSILPSVNSKFFN